MNRLLPAFLQFKGSIGLARQRTSHYLWYEPDPTPKAHTS